MIYHDKSKVHQLYNLEFCNFLFNYLNDVLPLHSNADVIPEIPKGFFCSYICLYVIDLAKYESTFIEVKAEVLRSFG